MLNIADKISCSCITGLLNFYETGSIAIIYGYATKEDVKKASVGKWDKVNPVLDYTILYSDLKPISELVNKFK